MSDPTPQDPGQKIPKGSYAAGRRVLVPQGAEAPIVVYVNGVAQTEGEDYNLRGNEILFTRDILKEVKSRQRKAIMLLGVVGFYAKDETVDVEYRRNGKTELAPDLPIQP